MAKFVLFLFVVLFLTQTCLSRRGNARDSNSSDSSDSSSSESSSSESKSCGSESNSTESNSSECSHESKANKSNIPKTPTTDKPSQSVETEANALGITVSQLLQIKALGPKPDISSPIYLETACKLCEILNSAKAALTVNAAPAEVQYFDILLLQTQILPDPEKIPVIIVACNYLYDPQRDVRGAKAFHLPLSKYHQFESIRVKGKRDRTSPVSVAVARKLCDVFHYTEIIATLIPIAQPPVLSQKQIIVFKALINEVAKANDTSRASAFENVCQYLGEIVSPNDQAYALGIPIDLYHDIVKIRKNNTQDESPEKLISDTRHICNEINIADGIFDRGPTSDVSLSLEQLQVCVRNLTAALNDANNRERIPLLRKVCVYLNESIPMGELATRFGLSVQQFEHFQEIKKNNADNSTVGLVALTRKLCDFIDPPSDKTVRNDIILTQEQLKEFNERSNRIEIVPIDERLPLFRENCALVNGDNNEVTTGQESNWI